MRLLRAWQEAVNHDTRQTQNTTIIRVYEKLSTIPNAPKRSEAKHQMMSRTLSFQHIADFESSKQGSTENWFLAK